MNLFRIIALSLCVSVPFSYGMNQPSATFKIGNNSSYDIPVELIRVAGDALGGKVISDLETKAPSIINETVGKFESAGNRIADRIDTMLLDHRRQFTLDLLYAGGIAVFGGFGAYMIIQGLYDYCHPETNDAKSATKPNNDNDNTSKNDTWKRKVGVGAVCMVLAGATANYLLK